MRRFCTRIISMKMVVLLAAPFFLLSFSSPAYASLREDADASGVFAGAEVTWSLESGILTIRGRGDMPDFGFDGFDFGGKKNEILACYLDPGVTRLGSFALKSCPNLSFVSIPDSVRSIGFGALAYNPKLTDLFIPENVVEMAWDVLLGCTGLRELSFYSVRTPVRPDGVPGGSGAIFGCTNLERFYVPAGRKPEYMALFLAENIPNLGDIIIERSMTPDSIGSMGEAEAYIKDALRSLTPAEKDSSWALDLLALRVQEAALRATTMALSEDTLPLDAQILAPLFSRAQLAHAALARVLQEEGVSLHRSVASGVTLQTQSTNRLRIVLGGDTTTLPVDMIQLLTPHFSVRISKSFLERIGTQTLVITLEGTSGGDVTSTKTRTAAYDLLNMSNRQTASSFSDAPNTPDVYTLASDSASAAPPGVSVHFSRPPGESITLSLPLPASIHPDYSALFNESNQIVGGKHNPITNMSSAKVSTSGIFQLKNNSVTFDDVAGKPQEMRDAIHILASKGIIAGVSPHTFNPDAAINRAEVTALVMRALSRLDPSADGGFIDVRPTDWFFGAVGSAKRHGVVGGVSPTRFVPLGQIINAEIVAITSRVLRMEMHYHDPSDPEAYLALVTNRSQLPVWVLPDLALAYRENLIPRREDGQFLFDTRVTRCEAAIILYQMFMKIW